MRRGRIVWLFGILLLVAGCMSTGTVANPSDLPTLLNESIPEVDSTLKPTRVTLEFSCVPASDKVMTDAIALGQPAGMNRNPKNWVIVDVGEGQQPKEHWSIVAIRVRQADQQRKFAFLTNSMSANQPSGEKWIPIGNDHTPEETAFRMVDWPEPKLELARQARSVAFNCLERPLSQDEEPLVCEPLSIPSIAGLNRRFNVYGDVPGDWTAGDAVMVHVGPGNNPDEEWWIVAARNFDSESGEPKEDLVFLTNSPGYSHPSGDVWIPLMQFTTQGSAVEPWEAVHWSETQIARGKSAEAVARDCLAPIEY